MQTDKRQTCVACEGQAPELAGETTLMSSVGWRLTWRVLPNGTFVREWRCPSCWANHKFQTAPPLKRNEVNSSST